MNSLCDGGPRIQKFESFDCGTLIIVSKKRQNAPLYIWYLFSSSISDVSRFSIIVWYADILLKKIEFIIEILICVHIHLSFLPFSILKKPTQRIEFSMFLVEPIVAPSWKYFRRVIKFSKILLFPQSMQFQETYNLTKIKIKIYM